LEGKPYRVRSFGSRAWNLSDAAEGKGAFHVVTVVAAELLNEELQPVTHPLNMAIDRVVYVREIDFNETADSYQVDLVLKDEDSSVETTLQNVTMRRVGKTAAFVSDAISIISPDEPLQPLGVTGQPSADSLVAKLRLKSLAGTLSPTSGSYQALSRRNGPSMQTKNLQKALTRHVRITDATANFDGITAGIGTAAQDQILANVTFGRAGWAAARIFNVSSSAIYTFDRWPQTDLGQWLTTPLGSDGMVMGSTQQGQLGSQLVLGPSGGQPFVPIQNGQTLWPGLYRIWVIWGKTADLASQSLGPPAVICDSDKLTVPLCENEWIVSVGQRVFLDIDADASSDLGADLSTIPNESRSQGQFVRDLAEAVSQKFLDAGGNVRVVADAAPLRPYLRHVIRKAMPTGSPLAPVYGMTSHQALFPLKDPNLDLGEGTDTSYGVNLAQIFEGRALGAESSDDTFTVHSPMRQANSSTCGDRFSSNPCPKDVFFNRFLAVVAHETAHGLGLQSTDTFQAHGQPAAVRQNNATGIDARFVGLDFVYEEVAPGVYSFGNHEAFDLAGLGFGDQGAPPWIMQWGVMRWNGLRPDSRGAYDNVGATWLVFDRNMWFSKKSEYESRGLPDGSTESYLKERIPLCAPQTRACR
jgi:hypothetical protein